MADKPRPDRSAAQGRRPKSRRAALRAALFLGLALVAAVGSALLLTRYMEARTAAARVPTRKRSGGGDAICRWAPRSARSTSGRSTGPSRAGRRGPSRVRRPLEGKVVSIRMVKGEPFLAAKLAGERAGAGLVGTAASRDARGRVRVDDVVGRGRIHPPRGQRRRHRHAPPRGREQRDLLEGDPPEDQGPRGGQGARPARPRRGQGRAGHGGHAHGGRGAVGTARSGGGAGKDPPHAAQRRRPRGRRDTRASPRRHCSRSPSDAKPASRDARARTAWSAARQVPEKAPARWSRSSAATCSSAATSSRRVRSERRRSSSAVSSR